MVPVRLSIGRRAAGIALASGVVGFLVPFGLPAIARCCLDSAPAVVTKVFDQLFRFLWPTSELIPPYLLGGPVDREALRRTWAIAVAANAIVYAAVALIAQAAWARLIHRPSKAPAEGP